ncbi:MAG: CRISPR-associated RAMP protein Csx7 [Armatimonadetes bacterium]|nr:CRISPR-associated RAMP protein Csx7 [Armatimonadota bacterium]MDW8122429.1 CRISPR-associated RAMP protein Csx7 [Armatimonadota bacterium]
MGPFFKFESRTILKAILTMKTALSIGRGASLMPEGSDLPVVKSPEGVPYIPGSSLKGVVRSYAERLLRTCDQMQKTLNCQKLWSCDPFDEVDRCVVARCPKPCNRCEACRGNCCDNCSRCRRCLVQKFTSDGRLNDEGLAAALLEKSCTACRLFGSPWIASRILFQDAPLVNKDQMLLLTEIRNGVGIDRDLGTARPRVLYDFETVPAGAQFFLQIVAENVPVSELAILLLALNGVGNSEVPLGGKTTRGVGWGQISEIKIERIEAQDLLNYLVEGKGLRTIPVTDILKSFASSLQCRRECYA